MLYEVITHYRPAGDPGALHRHVRQGVCRDLRAAAARAWADSAARGGGADAPPLHADLV